MSAHDQFVIQMGGGLRLLAKRHRLKLREATILSALILLDGMEGCHPSQETIAEVLGTSRGVVQPGLAILEEVGLIRKEKRRYWDSRRRECRSKNHIYILSEEIQEAAEYSAETLERRRRATPPSLIGDDQMRLAANPIWMPDVIGCQSDLDQEFPVGEGQNENCQCQMRLAANPIWMPDVIGSQSDLDQMRATANHYRGGGGKKDQYMTLIRSVTPTTPPTFEERELSMQMLTHPAIAMPRDFAQAIAARWSPREILERSRAYSADYKAEGGANGVGALIYRFAHFDSLPNRKIRVEDLYDHEWYSEFEYLVGLQEGLYEPVTEEEEPEGLHEEAHASEEAGPRPALVLADALTDPNTTETVFNTIELTAQRYDADQDAWQAVVDEMAMVMPASTYHTWLHGQTEFVGRDDDRFTIRTASAFVRDWLHSRLKKKMEAALKDMTGRSVDIEFLTDTQIVEETKGNGSPGPSITAHAGTARWEGQRGP